VLADDPATLRAALEQRLLGDDPGAALQALCDSGALAAALPELAATVGFAQEMGRRHKDVWAHTKQVVQQAPAVPALRWAALLHDIGKVPTRDVSPKGKVTFHGHAEAGARLFDRIAARLAFPEPLAATVRFLILNHLRASHYAPSWTDSAVRRFARELGEHLPALLLLSRADVTSARPEKRQHAARSIDELEARIAAVRELDARRPPLPSGIGDALIARFGLAPGRLIGELKRELEALVAEGALEPFREAEYYLAALAARPEQVARLAAEHAR
jgi:poly(A) polymerase